MRPNITVVAWCSAAVVLFSNDPSRLFGQSLGERLLPVIGAHRGEVAVAVRHLPSGQVFNYREREPQATASLIKFPVMVAAYRQSERGSFDLDQSLTLKESDKVQGSGILTNHFSPGTVVSLHDAIRLMMAFSDNTATNLVLDQLGIQTVSHTMVDLGFAETQLHSKVFRRDTSVAPERSERYGLGSTTAGEIVRLCEMLHGGLLANTTNTQAMLEHMQACDDRLKIRRHLPSSVKIAHKTGSVDRVRNDGGIMETEQGPVAFCVLTEKNEDATWGDENKGDLLCSEIGQRIYEHFRSNNESSKKQLINDIAIGSSGPLVRSLQRTLNAQAELSPLLSVDGEFGPSTTSAIKTFQERMGLEATGKLSIETWKKLGPLLPDEVIAVASAVAAAPLPVAPDSLDGPPWVTASAWAVVDGATGEVLYQHEGDALRDPASTTKIMTALLVVEHAQSHPEVLDETLVFSMRADGTGGSTSDLYAGERITVGELLYGLMLPSGNDASVAFAEHFGDRLRINAQEPGGYASFISAMNRKAQELGLQSTHYENPHGLTHAQHKSSACDLAKLARRALQYPVFRQLVSTSAHETIVESEVGYSRIVKWKNTNRLLDIQGYDGVKTGTTDAAGACLVSRGTRGDRQLLVVVLGAKSSESRYAETRNLFRWAWNELGVK